MPRTVNAASPKLTCFSACAPLLGVHAASMNLSRQASVCPLSTATHHTRASTTLLLPQMCSKHVPYGALFPGSLQQVPRLLWTAQRRAAGVFALC